MLGMTPIERSEAKVAKYNEAKERIEATPKPTRAFRPKANMSMLRQSGELFNNRVLLVPDEHFERALNDTDFLGPIVAQLNRMDRVIVLNESGTKEADCVLLGLNEHGAQAQLHVRHVYDYERPSITQADLDALYDIKDEGFAKGFAIYRKADNVKMAGGDKTIRTFDQALQRRRELHAQKLS